MIDLPDLPVAYLLSRDFTPEQIEDIHRVLNITPIECVLVCDAYGIDKASEFHELIIRCDSQETAIQKAFEIHDKLQQVALIIGNTPHVLDEILPDGTHKQVI